MSDILDKKIEMMMSGPRIDIVTAATEQELRDGYALMLDNVTRLTCAINILFPDAIQVGEGSIDCAIRLLEMLEV